MKLTPVTILADSVSANFLPDDSTGCPGFAVDFKNTSYGATGYSWNFGDGGTSTAKAPTYTYVNAGTYNVTLIASSICAADTNAVHSIEVLPGGLTPTASFSLADPSDTVVCTFQTIDFINNSTDATGYVWDFGDGNVSTLTAPSYSYSAPGTYAVVLSADYECSAITDYDSVIIRVYTLTTPNASFTSDLTEGCGSSVTINFTPDDPVSFVSYFWKFDSESAGGPTSVEVLPFYIFTNTTTNTKEFTVRLIVTNCNGLVDSSENVITLYPAASANFTANKTLVAPNEPVQFTYTGTGAANFDWTFGDGNTSTDQDPVNVYGITGTYSVHLSVIDTTGDCADIKTKSNYIVVDENIGISEPANSTNHGLNIYPNPVSHIANVSFTLVSPGKVTLELFDIYGRNLAVPVNGLSFKHGEINISVDLNRYGIPDGVYLMKLVEKGSQKVARFAVVGPGN